MFLTTEPSLAGKNYNILRVIFATVSIDTNNNLKNYPMHWDTAIENALAKLHAKSMDLGADGVIGVHVSTADFAGRISATVMGTSIKFY